MARATGHDAFAMHCLAYCNMSDICHRETTNVLAKFNPQQRTALLKEIGGSFQLANQKAKWLPEQDE